MRTLIVIPTDNKDLPFGVYESQQKSAEGVCVARFSRREDAVFFAMSQTWQTSAVRPEAGQRVWVKSELLTSPELAKYVPDSGFISWPKEGFAPLVFSEPLMWCPVVPLCFVAEQE